MTEFGVLGQLTVSTPEGAVDVGPRKQRMLLGLLLRSANTPQPGRRFIEALWWGGTATTSSASNLRVYVHQLRRALRDDQRITLGRGGYALRVAPGELDAHRFIALTTDGRHAHEQGDAERASALRHEALRLWRGPAYTDLTECPALHHEASWLEEQRMTVLEDRLLADLSLGRHAQLISELRGLVTAHPLRERFPAQLMLALYRADRQAEALRVYQDSRRALTDELGIEPGPKLRRLHQAILTGDPSLDLPEAAVTLPSTHHLTATTPPPAELPPDPAGFTGRSVELERLRAELIDNDARKRPAVVTVTGIGGVGKSALAVHLGHHIAEHFPDGQLYVNLHGSTPHVAPLAPAEALARMLRSLGVASAAVPHDVDEAAGRFRTLTDDKRLLVVLDNALDAAQVRLLLPANPGCGVVVTSRARLTVDHASHHSLDLLADDQTLALLAQLTGAERLAAEPEAAAEVARHCAHLPLAICIAAVRLTTRTSWPVRRLADRLAAEQRRLSELQVGDRAIRASFMVSYRALINDRHGDDAARMFRLISLLDTPDVGVPVAASVADLAEERAEDVLDHLVDLHLLSCQPSGRYRMHDLLRLFARERAAAEETETTRAEAVRHALHCHLATARSASRLMHPEPDYRTELGPSTLRHHGQALTTREDVYAWIDAEADNLVAIVRQAARVSPDSPGEPTLAVALAAALYFPLHDQGRWKEQIQIGDVALKAACHAGDTLHEAVMHGLVGEAKSMVGHPAEALPHMSHALTLYQRIDHHKGETTQRVRITIAHTLAGRFDEAIAHARQALAFARQHDDRAAEGSTLTNLGISCQRAGRFDEAIAAHTQAIALARELNQPVLLANRLGNLAEARRRADQPEAAVEGYREVLAADRAAEHSGTYGEAERSVGARSGVSRAR